MKKRTCRDWTEEETRKALALLEEGKSVDTIGPLLGRSTSTVRANLAKVPGYQPRPVGRPIGNVCLKVEVPKPRKEREEQVDSFAAKWLSRPMGASQ